MVAAGLVAIGRSAYDRFRGRLLWPIRDASGDTIGFGARRIFDDDRIEAKYLNTPETPIYKKSQVLYGIDLARRDMARSSQAVVVEGYTDVMACHLAGVRHGGRHLRHRVRRRPRPGAAPVPARPRGVPRRGDLHLRRRRRRVRRPRCGRSAATRTSSPRPTSPSSRTASTRATCGSRRATRRCASWSPGGSRCTASCSPTWSASYDLDRADGRVDAVREAARLVSSIRDKSKVDAFSRELAGMVGVDIEEARAEVRRAAPNRRASVRGPASATRCPGRRAHRRAEPAPRPARPPVLASSARPSSWSSSTRRRSAGPPRDVGANDFTHPTYRAVWELVAAAGGPAAGAGDPGWAARLRDAATDPAVSSAISALGVEPLRTPRSPTRPTSPPTSTGCWS